MLFIYFYIHTKENFEKLQIKENFENTFIKENFENTLIKENFEKIIYKRVKTIYIIYISLSTSAHKNTDLLNTARIL